MKRVFLSCCTPPTIYAVLIAILSILGSPGIFAQQYDSLVYGKGSFFGNSNNDSYLLGVAVDKKVPAYDKAVVAKQFSPINLITIYQVWVLTLCISSIGRFFLA